MAKQGEAYYRYSYRELSAFCLQISLLLEAAVPLDEGLSIMAEDAADKKEKDMLLYMAEGVELGDPFFKVLEDAKVFPDYVVKMAKLGQQTGTMEHYQLIMNEFCDFFKASTTLSGGAVTSFVYEMGEDGKDHSTWYAPEKMWDRDSSETYSVTDGASNVAAQYAAALAQNYIISGREEDLTYATALYNFAAKYRKMTDNQSTYRDKDVQDDISWAAGWMYLATKQDDYLTENSKQH